MSTTYGPGLTPLRFCAICLAHYVREAEHYLCPTCDDPGLRPRRAMLQPLVGQSISAAWGGGM